MSYTYHELKEKKISELRDIASKTKHEAIKGYTQLNKDHLLAALCKAFNLDMFEHHKAMGINKTRFKTKIKELKKKRDQAMSSGDRKTLKDILSRIHSCKRRLHKATI